MSPGVSTKQSQRFIDGSFSFNDVPRRFIDWGAGIPTRINFKKADDLEAARRNRPVGGRIASAGADDSQSSVSNEWVSGRVVPFACWLKFVNPLDFYLAGCSHVLDKFVALGVDIGRYVVCRASVGVTDADPNVTRGRPDP